MTSFGYARPASIEEALALLAQYGPEAKILAGGTDLLVRIRNGHMLPKMVIDLKQVPGLGAGITRTGSRLRIGALTTMAGVLEDQRVGHYFPALVEAARVVGSVQIRNRATLTGNICNASPAADTVLPLLVYGAVVNTVSSTGRRSLPLAEVFLGPGKTALERGEIVESIELPLPAPGTGAAFARVTRRWGVDLATVNLCCAVDSSGTVRFAYGAVAPQPVLVEDSSGVLVDPAAGSDEKDAVLRRLIARTSPRTDVRGGRDYRGAMLLVMSRRALERACEAARVEGSVYSGVEPALAPLNGGPTESRGRGLVFPAGPVPIVVTVNRERRTIETYPHRTLLELLRDELGLTGTKECCSVGECGACTVLMNGRAVDSCLVLAVEADGAEIVTIEGVGSPGRLSAVQAAFTETGAIQCGFCTPGMVISAEYLLERNPHPTVDEIKQGLDGNLCRCAGYSRIIEAVKVAAEARK